VLAAVAAVLIALVTAVRQDGGDRSAAMFPTRPPQPSEGVTSSRGPQPPASGSWVGAVVQPADYAQPARILAISEYETKMGRQLDMVHTYHTWQDRFPDPTDRWVVDNDRMLMLSWGGTDTRLIQSGRYDDLIRQRARDLKEWHAKILLQWRWEMDRPNLQQNVRSAPDYIAAWTHIRAIFQQEGVTNVSWVWCPTAEGFTLGRAQAYYPGDDQVDWLCATVYPDEVNKNKDFGSVSEAFLTWAKGHPKPIAIGEYGAYPGYPGGLAAWVRQAAETARRTPAIKAMIYFDSDDPNGKPFFQHSLRKDASAIAAFRDFLADPYFNPRKLPALN